MSAMESSVRRLPSLLLVLVGLLCAAPVARAQNYGFQINRYEPTPAGEWSFMIDHPWYSSTRHFAAGVTLNYGHEPLVYGRLSPDGTFTQIDPIIRHQLIGHIDLAGSFADRVTVALSLPITLLERGQEFAGVRPVEGGSVGDPRLSAMVRVFGQPERGGVSLHAGLALWFPLRAFTDSLAPQSSDQGVRLLPKLVLAGHESWLRWSALVGFLYRPEAYIGDFGNAPGSTVGSELQLGGSVQYADPRDRFAVGPELLLATVVNTGQAFARDATGLDLLLGGHVRFLRDLQAGLGAGVGILREPGTPDFRLLVRLAYAPRRALPTANDRDGDGIPDDVDACRDVPGERSNDPRVHGCPAGDRDGDGIIDMRDRCPEEAAGPHPDPARVGCPLSDRDGDGVPDVRDACPDEPQGARPDPQRLGCPMPDRDRDGVADIDDQCVDVPAGARPDPQRRGCPIGDLDRDGVLDTDDLCVDVPAGLHPDPQRTGCPLADRDRDNVPDAGDACPDKAGSPSPDPRKNGCPGLVALKDGQIQILKPVFFATDKDVILPQSFPVLQAVADALRADMAILRMAVEGHTDNRGSVAHNTDLSDRRAKSVMRWLVDKGHVNPERLSARGYGPMRPIADNATNAGRAQNRRVDFVIIDPPQIVPQTAPAN